MAVSVLTNAPVLIAAPVLVLAIVALFGFAGCTFHAPPHPPDPIRTLKFRVRVPAEFNVGPGVTFAWTRPTLVMESALVNTPTVDGTDNLLEQEIPAPEAGMWTGICSMDATGSDLLATSAEFQFTPDFFAKLDWVLAFHTEGSPTTPPFNIVVDGLI
jgi:hypothetical protein